jgi:hypothetical protein
MSQYDLIAYGVKSKEEFKNKYIKNISKFENEDLEKLNNNNNIANIMIDKYIKSNNNTMSMLLSNLKNIKIRIGTRNRNNKIISKLVSLKKIMKKKSKDIIQKNPKIHKGRIDTTFCVYNKKFLEKDRLTALQIGDNFSCKHLPWEKNYKIPKNENKFYIKTKIQDVSSTDF